jgi:hypothetical protein
VSDVPTNNLTATDAANAGPTGRSAYAAPMSRHAALPRSALIVSLLRREFSPAAVLLLAVTFGAGYYGASHAAALRAGGTADPIFARLLLRFDLTLLGAAALIAVLRTVQRTVDDQASHWLEGYRAAGADMRAYGPALAFVSGAAAWLLFAAGASGFALGVARFDAAFELLRALPVLLISGALLIASHAALAAALAGLIRDALATLLVHALLAFGPLAAMMIQFSRGGGDAPLLKLALHLSPPTQTVHAAAALPTALLYLTACTLLAAVAASRLAGRRT